MEKVKIGFVGYGYWGKNILRNLVALSDIAEVKIVCENNKNNLATVKKVYPQIPVFTRKYDDVINSDVDAVVLATPPSTHFDLASLAIRHDKHVFVEKPMTTTINDGVTLVKMAKDNKKVLMVGHTFLYNPALNDVKKLIDDGVLGKVYYIDFIMTNLGKYQKHNVVWDLGPHGISIILHLLGNPEVVDVKMNGISAIKKDIIDIAYLTMYFKNKSFANIHFSWLNPNKVRQLTVVGSKKMVVFDDIDPLKKLWIYDKGVEDTKKDNDFNTWGDSIVGYRHGPIVIPKSSTGEPLKSEMKHFIECILNKTKPLTDGEHGLKVVKIIEKGLGTRG